MRTETAKVISAARSLPLEDRAEIVDKLVDSLYSEDPTTNDQWKELVEHRVAAFRNGDTKLVPMETVFEKAVELLGK
jgi:putative addiction module component (TIGR02574 family)